MDELLWKGFIRQRRNLLIVSLVLAFAQTANLTVDEINVVGNVLKVSHPVAVTYALWAFWLYWLYRYYVYYRDVGGSGFRNAYKTKLFELVRQHASDLIQYAPPIAQALKEADGTFLSAAGEPISLEGNYPDGYGIVAGRLVVTFRQQSGNMGRLDLGDRTVKVPYEFTRPYRTQSIRFVALHTRLVTDFWLPYVVAAVPVVILAGKIW